MLNLTFEKFVTDLKKYIVKNHHSSQYQKEYELLQIESLWKLTLEQYISVFPNLNISFALNPEASTNYNPYEYWKTLNSVDWSLSFSTGISFSTRKSLFSTANEYKLEKEKFKVQYNQTREAMKNEVIIREKKMELYTFLEEQNSQLFYAELKRTEQFESLYLLGRITEYEFNIQRFIKEEAYINWYFSKLNKELFLLSCY